jgi:signal transduction histidine kinase/ligand-binding sensor domain-containing protein
MRGACSRARFTVALGALLAGSSASALNPAFEVNQYAHKSWTAADGYFKGSVTDIAQTPDGYLWLGTDFGLVRFDGVRFVPWTPPAGAQLPSDASIRLLVTRDGSLWIGTAKGLARWKGNRLTSYRELAGRRISKILEDHSGVVWVAGMGAPAGPLCAIRVSGVQCGGDGDFGSNVVSLYEYQGGVWAGTSRALWRWKPDPPQFYPVPGSEGAISDLIEGDNGALWMATNKALLQWAGGKIEPAPVPSAAQTGIHRMLLDRDGGMWIGTIDQGLVHLHQGRTDVFGTADGLSGYRVEALFEDREGDVWAATEEGLDRFHDLAAATISIRQGLPGGSPGGIVASQDGSIWLGTNNGLEQWNNGRLTVYRRPSGGGAERATGFATRPAVREIDDSGLPDNLIESLFEDHRGRIWVSTRRGVGYLENGRFVPVGSVLTTMVHAIAEEGSGSVWINEQPLGLIHLVDGRVVEQVSWASLGRQAFATAVAADPARGGLWLSFFQGGLAYFKDGRVRLSYSAAEGLGGGRVSDIRIDRDGTLWASTEGGLSRLKDGRISTLTSRNGLPCDAVLWATEDDARSVWLNQPCGLVRVTRTEMDEWAASEPRPPGSGEPVMIHPTVFDRSDGVKSLLFSGYSPPFAKSADGKLWFQMKDGFGVVDPRHLPLNQVPPPVHIEQITADRKVFFSGRLPALTRDLEIDYTALSLVAPEKNQFRYKLEGYDTDWQDAGNRRQAFYTNLSPRNYRFRVMASNNSGVWNETGDTLSFSIAPAYYQTSWFFASCVAAFLALLAGLYRLRLLYLTKQFNARLEGRVSERTRVARDLHDTLLQSFQGVLLKFSTIKYMIHVRPDEAAEALERTIEQARAAITEGRDAVQGLRSSVVIANDLARAITTFAQGCAADHSGPDCPEFRVYVEGKSRDLPPLVRDEVYKIACESLRNAFQHAQAKRIEVQIRYDPRRFRLEIVDNGKGIDAAVLNVGGRAGHHGLPGLHERAQIAGGKLSVWSQVNSGTEIELTIPAAIAYTRSAPAGRSIHSGKGAE